MYEIRSIKKKARLHQSPIDLPPSDGPEWKKLVIRFRLTSVLGKKDDKLFFY